MRKKIITFSILITVTILLMLSYSSYCKHKANAYVKYLCPGLIGTKDNVKIEKIIKQTPTTLVILIKWGDNKAYLSIENWMTKAHDKITVDVVDKEKSFRAYE